FIETAQVFFGTNRIWTYDGFLRDRAIEGDEDVNLDVRLRGGWQVSGSVARAFVYLDPADYSDLRVLRDDVAQPYEPLSDVSGFQLEVGVETPTWQKLEARIGLDAGRVAI